jgi:DNA-binding HxlR family transcriptional regulator
MKNNFRSGCPLASTLDIVGDKWSLLIIRDMLLQGKKTFKDFSISPEGNSTRNFIVKIKVVGRK